MILCFDDLQPKQYIKTIKITIYMTIRRLYYLLTGVCTRFCAKILSLSLPGNFLNEKCYSLIRLLTSRFVSFGTLFCLSDTQNPTNNVTYETRESSVPFHANMIFYTFGRDKHQTSFSEISTIVHTKTHTGTSCNV